MFPHVLVELLSLHRIFACLSCRRALILIETVIIVGCRILKTLCTRMYSQLQKLFAILTENPLQLTRFVWFKKNANY